jgi:hypothetical protein
MKTTFKKLIKIMKSIKDILVSILEAPLWITLIIVLILLGLFELLKTDGGLTKKILEARKSVKV